jgi:hypothetical protein
VTLPCPQTGGGARPSASAPPPFSDCLACLLVLSTCAA